MVFRPELSWEFFSPDDLAARTIRSMRNHVRHIREASPWYREVLRDINPEDLQTPADIAKLPITTKDTLNTNRDKFLAVSSDSIVETVVSSGFTGDPVFMHLTDSDLDRLAYNDALSFYGAGITRQDTVHLLTSLDKCAQAGMSAYRGLTLLGASVARVGMISAEVKKQYLEKLKPTALVGTPWYLKKLSEDLITFGFNTRESTIRKIFCTSESVREQSLSLSPNGKSLEEMWRAQVYSHYSVTELGVTYCECNSHAGGHAHPELVYSEIVDEHGNCVPDGVPGELVATPLGVEGMPLLRYRTGDITFKISEPCSCGRSAPRLGPILSRNTQAIKIRGTTIYPLTITNIVDEFDEVKDYIILLEGDPTTLSDQVSIHAALPPDIVPALAEALRARAKANIPILVSNVNTVQYLRGDKRKKTRLVDKREKPPSDDS